MRKLNKKGATLSGWFEAISIFMIVAFGVSLIFQDMNLRYSQSYSLPISSETNSYIGNLTEKIPTAQGKFSGSTASFCSSIGLCLKNAWDVIISMASLILDFITGAFIANLFIMAFNGSPIAITGGIVIQLLWIGGIVFAGIRLIQRVKP